MFPFLQSQSSFCFVLAAIPISLSFSLQAPCDNLRTPSTYPGNMLPHHPGQGNFEDFTCWADLSKASPCVLCNQSRPYSNKLSDAQTVKSWCWWTKTEAFFYIETEKEKSIKHDKGFPSNGQVKERVLNIKKYILIFRETFHAAVQTLLCFSSGILPQQVLVEKVCQQQQQTLLQE